MTVRLSPTRLIPFVLAFALGLGAAALTACGSSANKALIPATDADQLKSHLAAVQDAIDSGQCDKVTSALSQAQADVDALPTHVSVRLRRLLTQGIDQLKAQAPKACASNSATTATTQTATTVAPVTTATTPTVVPTTTTPTTTTPTTTTPPATTPNTTSTSSDTGGVTTP